MSTIRSSLTAFRASLSWLALALPAVAGAADQSWYVGAGYSELSRDPDFNDYPPDLIGRVDQEDGFKVMAGWQPLKWLAIEAAYHDLGSQEIQFRFSCPGPGCAIGLQEESSAISLAAVGMWPVGPVELFVRAGLARWKRESEATLAFMDPARFSESEDVLTYGAGLQYRLGSFAIRLEYENLDGDELETEALSVGLTWRFL